MKKPSLLDRVRKDLQASNEFVEFMRRIHRAADAAEGPTRLSVEKVLRFVRRHLFYAFWVPLQLTLVLVFNLAAMVLLLWLLSTF